MRTLRMLFVSSFVSSLKGRDDLLMDLSGANMSSSPSLSSSSHTSSSHSFTWYSQGHFLSIFVNSRGTYLIQTCSGSEGTLYVKLETYLASG